jgi:hypothetical protein
MAKARMDLSTFVGKLLEEQDGHVLREGVRVLAQALMDTEAAGNHSRSGFPQPTQTARPLRSHDAPHVGVVAYPMEERPLVDAATRQLFK